MIKLNINIVEQSVFVIFFSLIKLPPNPESITVSAIESRTAKTPIVPKSYGVKNLASIKLKTKYNT